MTKGFIPTHGGYQKLLSYQKAEIIYDATVYFTRRFYRTGDRTIDQMVQAARSGKQNIAEVTNYLLDKQIRSLEQTFVKEGGLRERMTRARLASRNKF